MPPVRQTITSRSRKERDRNFVSPGRGRGRRSKRTTHEAGKPTNTRPQHRGKRTNTATSTSPATVTVAESTHEAYEFEPPGRIEGQNEETSSNISGECDILLPTVDALTHYTNNSEFDGPPFNISDYQPPHTPSSIDPISAHVPLKVKQKIWEGKFVDLSILLKSARELSDHLETQGQIQIRNGTMCLVKHKPRTFLSIDKWTSAFIIFTSIMLEKYRSRAQEFLKYMRDVRLAADRSANGWFTYDEQFRLRKVSDPHSSWGIINSELWLIHVTNNYTMQAQEKPIPPTQNFFPQHKHPNIPTAKKKVNSPPNRYCYVFNSGKSCKFYPNCRFVHSCNSCGGSHPSIKCRNRNTQF